jgi:hypothetical protein
VRAAGHRLLSERCHQRAPGLRAAVLPLVVAAISPCGPSLLVAASSRDTNRCAFMLHCVAARCTALQHIVLRCCTLYCVAACYSALQEEGV